MTGTWLNMGMEMAHGTGKQDWQPHVGACLTDDYRVAATYARMGLADPVVYDLDVDLDGLVVAEAQAFEFDSNVATGDDDQYPAGVDVVTYGDADERGYRHRTWRLCTPAAVAAVTIHTAHIGDDAVDALY